MTIRYDLARKVISQANARGALIRTPLIVRSAP